VGGADGTSRYNERLRGVAHPLQVRKHCVEAQRDVPSNVLKQAPSGPFGGNKGSKERPEVAVIVRASPLPGATERLARVASANKVGARKLVGEGGVLDVAPPGDAGPVPVEDSVAVVIYLHLCHANHPGPL
jgi:hypothetical protein